MLQEYLRNRWVELLVAGVWLQSVINALFSGKPTLMLLTVFGGVVVLVVVFSVVERLRRRASPPLYGHGEALEVRREAVVFTVGRQEETIVFALTRQQPVWLGLVCSTTTEDTADKIIASSGLDVDHVKKEIVDPWNVVDVRDHAGLLLGWLETQSVPRAAIAVDITGGTAIMSAAVFSVASERQVDTQYVRSDYDQFNRPIRDTQRGVYVARFRSE